MRTSFNTSNKSCWLKKNFWERSRINCSCPCWMLGWEGILCTTVIHLREGPQPCHWIYNSLGGESRKELGFLMSFCLVCLFRDAPVNSICFCLAVFLEGLAWSQWPWQELSTCWFSQATFCFLQWGSAGWGSRQVLSEEQIATRIWLCIVLVFVTLRDSAHDKMGVQALFSYLEWRDTVCMHGRNSVRITWPDMI